MCTVVRVACVRINVAVGETCDMDGMDEKVSYHDTDYYTSLNRHMVFSISERFILNSIVFDNAAS